MLELIRLLPSFVLLNRETDKVLWGRSTKRYWNHRQDVDKWLPILSEIDELDTDFGEVLNSIPHVVDHVLVDILALRRSCDRAARRLEEAAILAEHLAFRIASQMCEGIRGVNNRTVGLVHIADNEGTRGVYKADVDDWIWSLSKAPLLWKSAPMTYVAGNINQRA